MSIGNCLVEKGQLCVRARVRVRACVHAYVCAHTIQSKHAQSEYCQVLVLWAKDPMDLWPKGLKSFTLLRSSGLMTSIVFQLNNFLTEHKLIMNFSLVLGCRIPSLYCWICKKLLILRNMQFF